MPARARAGARGRLARRGCVERHQAEVRGGVGGGVQSDGQGGARTRLSSAAFNKEDGSSVVANNPDGRTDAGQMAMIDSVPAGDNDLKFIFVAQQQTTCSTRPDPNGKRPPCDDTPSVEGLLRFESMKAVSYPGGDRYKTYDQCEQNPFAEGCDG